MAAVAAAGGGGASARTEPQGEALSQAANVDIFRSQSLLAQYESFDATGCIATDIIVQGTVQREVTSAKGKQVIPSASVLLSVFDTCTFESLLNAGNSTNSFQMQVGPQLSSAHLSFSLTALNQPTNGPVVIDVNLSWTATSPIVASHEHAQVFADGTRFVENASGAERSASVAGTVSIAGLNYASDPAGWFNGDIQNLGDGLITITPSAKFSGASPFIRALLFAFLC